MNGHSRVMVAAIVGCLVGSIVTGRIVQGQMAAQQRPSPVQGTLSHLGFAVADVEKTAKAYAAVFNVDVPKSQDFRDIPWGPRFPGKKMNVRRIGLNINGVTFEFLQPLEGDSPWKEFLAKGGDGVHHIGFSVKDVAAGRAYMESKGGVQTQAYSEAANYIDMSKPGLGVTFELTAQPPQQAPPR